MKKILSVILSLVLIVALLPLFPVSARADYSFGDWTYDFDGSGITVVTGYTGTDLDLEIPAVMNGNKVKRIEMSAFVNNPMTSITIPEGITHISEDAFKYCSSLKIVRLPSTLQYVDIGAFYGCGITDVYYNGNESSFLNAITWEYSNESVLNAPYHHYLAPTLEEPVATSASVKLSWNAVTDATKYMMYRRDYNGGTWSSWTVKTKSITGTSWTDSGVTAGGQYEYKVRACVSGTFRGYSNVVNATVPVPAGAPTLSGAAQAGKNVLSWGAVSGATKYMMYRREYNGSSWGSWEIKSKSITGTSWTDSNVTAGNTYEYKARAYVGTAFGPYSNVVSLTAKAAATPPTLNGTAQAGKNVLNWTAVSGATKYMMYRREYNGSTWGSWEIKSKSLTGNTWTDSNVTAGNTYEYKMRACVDGVFGGYSNVVSLTAKAALPTATLSGIAQAGKNELNWTAVSGATKYMMCRREYSGGVWGSWEIKSKSLTGTSWTDTGVSGGCTYEYKLRACVDGVFGGYSNVVSLTQQPTATIYGEAMRENNELAWTYVPGATAYKVYRRVNSGSGWSSWTNVKTLYETNWSDTAVTEPYQYQYRVRARIGSEYGGYSNIVELQSPGASDMMFPIVAHDLTPSNTNVLFPEDMCWVANAECSAPLQYRFWIFLGGRIVKDSGYGSASYCYGEHGMEYGGPYTARVFLKNTPGDVVSMNSTVYVFCDEA